MGKKYWKDSSKDKNNSLSLTRSPPLTPRKKSAAKFETQVSWYICGTLASTEEPGNQFNNVEFLAGSSREDEKQLAPFRVKATEFHIVSHTAFLFRD